MYIQQIEANAVYVQYLKKAVSIAKLGLSSIEKIRNGEFNLHDLFFKGLGEVNPKIKNRSKVAAIVSFQISIVKRYKKNVAQIRSSGQFTSKELEYVLEVFEKLLNDCADVVLMLTDVISNDTFKMSDDERMKRIEALHERMKSNNAFCQRFSQDNLLLAMKRMKEQGETNVSKKLFGIH